MEGIAVVVSLAAGIGVVVFVFWVFLSRGGYADLEEFPDSVEHAHLRRVAERRVAKLCPGAIRLAEAERAGRAAPALAREFWRRFAAVSGSVEEDPVAALRDLRGVADLLDEALCGAERGVGMAKSAPGREDER